MYPMIRGVRFCVVARTTLSHELDRPGRVCTQHAPVVDWSDVETRREKNPTAAHKIHRTEMQANVDYARLCPTYIVYTSNDTCSGR